MPLKQPRAGWLLRQPQGGWLPLNRHSCCRLSSNLVHKGSATLHSMLIHQLLFPKGSLSNKCRHATDSGAHLLPSAGRPESSALLGSPAQTPICQRMCSRCQTGSCSTAAQQKCNDPWAGYSHKDEDPAQTDSRGTSMQSGTWQAESLARLLLSPVSRRDGTLRLGPCRSDKFSDRLYFSH